MTVTAPVSSSTRTRIELAVLLPTVALPIVTVLLGAIRSVLTKHGHCQAVATCGY